MSKDNTLGRMLLQVLKEKKMTISELSRRTGVPKSVLHSWTLGQDGVKLSQLRKVCGVLETPVARLVHEGGLDPFKNDSSEIILTKLFEGDLRVSIQRISRKA